MRDTESFEDWPGKGLGQAVKHATKAAGSSYVKLSERTRELGVSIHRTALGKIEKGERDLTVRELVVIAAALDISPLALVFPNVLADIEVLPGVTAAGIDVFGWWTGVGGPTRSVRGLFAKDDGLRIASQLADVENALRLHRLNLQRFEREYSLFERDSDREGIERSRERVDLLESERDRLVDAYRDAIEDRSDDA